jgi:hypothetical protein
VVFVDRVEENSNQEDGQWKNSGLKIAVNCAPVVIKRGDVQMFQSGDDPIEKGSPAVRMDFNSHEAVQQNDRFREQAAS